MMNSTAVEQIEEVIETAAAFGSRRLANGTRMYGHVPHVAPEAWLHIVFAPLTVPQLEQLELGIGRVLPGALRDFLLWANGLRLFFNLSMYGLRTSYHRTGDAAWQPFDLVIPNTLERPTELAQTAVVVGSYREDVSLLCLDAESGSVYRRLRQEPRPLVTWPDLATMLAEEAIRLSRCFDASGRVLPTVTSLLPSPRD